MSHTPKVLIILDGFGYRTERDGNAVALANMPNFNTWWQRYPHKLLHASGKDVGLLDGMAGNSAVGHMTIGAGKIIEQPIAQLARIIATNLFSENLELTNALKELARNNKTLHLLGLLSDGNVHSNNTQAHALIKYAVSLGVERIVVHALLDGRDVQAKSAAGYLSALELILSSSVPHGVIGSIAGRFYGMDRNNNWDLTERAYQVLTQKTAQKMLKWQDILAENYALTIFDEFIPPTQLNPSACIAPGDGLIFFNIRADRARQLTQLLLKDTQLHWIITGIAYQDTFKLPVLCEREIPTNTLLDQLEKMGKTIFTCAESEKYAHVTYFLNGGRETKRIHETRVIIPSARPETFEAYPEMAAREITDTVIASLKKNPTDFYVINYANADMIGHTGDLQATIRALKFLDIQLGRLYTEVIQVLGGTLYIAADHGNAEDKRNNNKSHTTNLVPFLVISEPALPQNILTNMHGLKDILACVLKERTRSDQKSS